MIKQFEISVSQSQSFRSGGSEKGKQTGLEHKPKPSHCLSTHKEDSTEVSTCKGILCIKPFLYLDQVCLMVRMILSHCTGICESREESKKKGDVQKVGQGKRTASDLPRSLMQREWISSTKVLILNCGNPFLPHSWLLCTFWQLMTRMVFFKVYKISFHSDKYKNVIYMSADVALLCLSSHLKM